MLPRADAIRIESGRLSIRPFSAHDAYETYPCITLSLTRWMSWKPPADRDALAHATYSR